MKKIRKSLVSSVIAMMVSIPLQARAGLMPERVDSLRCGVHLVQLGETQMQVLHQCGQPDVRDSYFVESGGLDRWTYNLGPKDFIYVFTFLNGELRQIMQTDRGF